MRVQLSIVGTAMGNCCAGLLLCFAVVYRRAADASDSANTDAHLRCVGPRRAPVAQHSDGRPSHDARVALSYTRPLPCPQRTTRACRTAFGSRSRGCDRVVLIGAVVWCIALTAPMLVPALMETTPLDEGRVKRAEPVAWSFECRATHTSLIQYRFVHVHTHTHTHTHTLTHTLTHTQTAPRCDAVQVRARAARRCATHSVLCNGPFARTLTASPAPQCAWVR
jgi:hypothetical protein